MNVNYGFKNTLDKLLNRKIWMKIITSKELQFIGNTFDMITIISRNYKNKHFIADKVSPQASST